MSRVNNSVKEPITLSLNLSGRKSANELVGESDRELVS